MYNGGYNGSFHIDGGAQLLVYSDGPILGNSKAGLSLDVQRMTSDGFQTFNHQQRYAGDIKLQYKISDNTILTGYSGWVMLDNNTPNTTAPTRTQAQNIRKLRTRPATVRPAPARPRTPPSSPRRCASLGVREFKPSARAS